MNQASLQGEMEDTDPTLQFATGLQFSA
jgi:hypothetical protein